jgi:hypothetical protein
VSFLFGQQRCEIGVRHFSEMDCSSRIVSPRRSCFALRKSSAAHPPGRLDCSTARKNRGREAPGELRGPTQRGLGEDECAEGSIAWPTVWGREPHPKDSNCLGQQRPPTRARRGPRGSAADWQQGSRLCACFLRTRGTETNSELRTAPAARCASSLTALSMRGSSTQGEKMFQGIPSLLGPPE